MQKLQINFKQINIAPLASNETSLDNTILFPVFFLENFLNVVVIVRAYLICYGSDS